MWLDSQHLKEENSHLNAELVVPTPINVGWQNCRMIGQVARGGPFSLPPAEVTTSVFCTVATDAINTSQLLLAVKTRSTWKLVTLVPAANLGLSPL